MPDASPECHVGLIRDENCESPLGDGLCVPPTPTPSSVHSFFPSTSSAFFVDRAQNIR